MHINVHYILMQKQSSPLQKAQKCTLSPDAKPKQPITEGTKMYTISCCENKASHYKRHKNVHYLLML